jgi:hypothetical protein
MRLEQALFGYRGGHRRLASSISFPPGDERFLVRMTDLSGSRSMPGFEDYVSGYALPSGTAYVFAKTWYAPECERPGCVWTHVIVVRHQEWTGITPNTICELFRRPPLEKASFDPYSDSLDVPPKACDEEDTPRLRMGEDIVRALYSDDRPIVVSESEKRIDLGSFLMRLVLQRPLAMRMALSFCTGSLSFLDTGSGPVRVQVMPFRISRQVREDVHLLPVEEKSPIPRWAEFLLEDLHDEDVILKRLFFPFQQTETFYGEKEAVAIIRGLAEARVLFEDVCKRAEVSQNALRGIVELFPGSKEQVAFKSSVIQTLSETSAGRRVLLRFIFETGDAVVALEGARREVRAVVSLFALEEPEAALQLLSEVLFQPYGSQFAQDVIQRLVSEVHLLDIGAPRPVDPQVLFAIAREQHELLSMPGFWLLQRSFEESTELAETLTEDLGEELVLAGLLAADRFDLLIRMLRMRGARGAHEAFRLAGGLSLKNSGDYNKVLALRDEVLDFAQALAWGEAYAMRPLNDAQLYILASSTVEPKRLVDLVPEVATWMEALAALPADPQRIFAVAVFLACGDEFTDGWKLFKKSFDIIHRAVAAKSIASEWWWLIKSRLPSLAIWEKWDRCERLRRGAVDSILRRGLPPAALGEISQDRDLEVRLREIYKDRK